MVADAGQLHPHPAAEQNWQRQGKQRLVGLRVFFRVALSPASAQGEIWPAATNDQLGTTVLGCVTHLALSLIRDRSLLMGVQS